MHRSLKLAACLAVTATTLPALAQTAEEQHAYDAAVRHYDEVKRRFEQETYRFQHQTVVYDYYRRRDGKPTLAEERVAATPPRVGESREENPQAYMRRPVGYDALEYYHPEQPSVERTVGPDEQVYRGSDGRFYCMRRDGYAALIVSGMEGIVVRGRNGQLGSPMGTSLASWLDGWQGDHPKGQPVRCR